MKGSIRYIDEYGSFYRVPRNMLPPAEAYRYFPTYDDIKMKKTEKADRLIFEGGTPYNNFELKILEEFHAYLENKNVQFDQEFQDSFYFKHLFAAKFKFKKCVQLIQEYITWRSVSLPIYYTSELEEALKLGFIFLHGKDRKYRPVYILNPGKIDKSKITYEFIAPAISWTMEYMIHYALLPGQIENWTVIIDLNKLGLTSLPKKVLQKLIGSFQNNYKARLGRMIMVNATTLTSFLWKIASSFVDEQTNKKIKLFTKNNPSILQELIHPSQLLERFGGKAPEPTSYWPPMSTSTVYDDEPEKKLVTESDYLGKLRTNSHLVPRPDLCNMYREIWGNFVKLPHKNYYFDDGVEEYGSFNNLINPIVDEEPLENEETNSLEEEYEYEEVSVSVTDDENDESKNEAEKKNTNQTQIQNNESLRKSLEINNINLNESNEKNEDAKQINEKVAENEEKDENIVEEMKENKEDGIIGQLDESSADFGRMDEFDTAEKEQENEDGGRLGISRRNKVMYSFLGPHNVKVVEELDNTIQADPPQFNNDLQPQQIYPIPENNESIQELNQQSNQQIVTEVNNQNQKETELIDQEEIKGQSIIIENQNTSNHEQRKEEEEETKEQSLIHDIQPNIQEIFTPSKNPDEDISPVTTPITSKKKRKKIIKRVKKKKSSTLNESHRKPSEIHQISNNPDEDFDDPSRHKNMRSNKKYNIVIRNADNQELDNIKIEIKEEDSGANKESQNPNRQNITVFKEVQHSDKSSGCKCCIIF